MKVSICVPTYKQLDYLRRTLDSVQSQTFQDFELIISDDSPDESVEILLSQYQFGDKLRYIRNPKPLGSPENWNSSIRIAEGEYIKILHHDDWFESPSSLDAFVSLIDSDKTVDFAFCSSRIFYVDKNNYSINSCTAYQLEALFKNPEILFVGNIIGAPSATIFRRSLFTNGFDRNLKWLVDVDFYIEIIKRSRRIQMTKDCLIVTPSNASHQVTESCKDNSTVELFEYQYVFDKYKSFLLNDAISRRFMKGVFERYRVLRLKDLDRLGVSRILSEDVFSSLNVRHFITLKIRDRILMCCPKFLLACLSGLEGKIIAKYKHLSAKKIN